MGCRKRNRVFLSLLLSWLPMLCLAQPVVITPPSAVIEPGESVTLTASGAMYYQWSPATGLSTTDGPVTVASPMVTTTYTCHGYAPGAESVVNGDFSQGNVGFNSAYQYNSNLWGEGTYYVDYDASLHHENFHGLGHGGTGNFMIVNGSTTPRTNVWTEQITVEPNSYYAFSTWVCTLAGQASEVALLQFSINGVQIGEVFSAPPQTYVWEQFYELWYSGNSTSATITILNQNTVGSGNDFGLDDISFCELVQVGAPQCTVSVESLTATATADDTELCEGASTTLHALPSGGVGDYSFSWTPSNSLSDASAMDPVATPAVGTTTYTCLISDGLTTVAVRVTITVHPNVETDIFQTICEDDSYQFFDDNLQAPGVYDHTLQTQYGCDSTIHLHLDNWQTYEANITDNICEGSAYLFFGQQLTTAGVYDHTLQTEHGCDSVVILNLGVWPTYETNIVADICEGDTYLFFGQQLDTTGTYTHTLQSVHGCDSTIVLNLGVWPSYATNITANICEGDTYSFFGQQLSTPGVYTQAFQSEHGFDSLIVLHLGIWPTYETNTADNICEGETYSFFGQQLSDAGVYTHTLSSVHGCDSTIILDLGFWPTYETNISDNICEGDTYTFFGQQLSTTGIQTHTLQSSHGCDSTIVLNLTVWPVYESYLVANICEGDAYQFFGQELSDEGIHSQTLTSSHGCDSTIILDLGVWPIYETNIAGSICEGDTYPFFGQQLSTAGVHTYTLQSEHGCDSIIRLDLSLNPVEQSEFTVSDDDNCDEYFWDPMGHEIVSTDYDGLYYSASGTYHRTYLNQAGCDSVVTMHVDFGYTPDPTAIMPVDPDNSAPHWVVTATEFQINAYDFHLWDNNPLCIWDTVTWSIEGSVQWVLEPYGDKAKCCKVFVLDHVSDTVWLKAYAFNRCAPQDGVERKYWLVCSFYGVDEQYGNHADFSVSPNPNNGSMRLNLKNLSGKVGVRVYDMKGNLVDAFSCYNELLDGSIQYDMHDRADGVYLFVITGKAGTVSKKVIISR